MQLRERRCFNQTWSCRLIASGEQLCSFSGNTLSPLNDYGPVGKGLLSAIFLLTVHVHVAYTVSKLKQ